jgi:hypothetical protein
VPVPLLLVCDPKPLTALEVVVLLVVAPLAVTQPLPVAEYCKRDYCSMFCPRRSAPLYFDRDNA